MLPPPPPPLDPFVPIPPLAIFSKMVILDAVSSPSLDIPPPNPPMVFPPWFSSHELLEICRSFKVKFPSFRIPPPFPGNAYPSSMVINDN